MYIREEDSPRKRNNLGQNVSPHPPQPGWGFARQTGPGRQARIKGIGNDSPLANAAPGLKRAKKGHEERSIITNTFQEPKARAKAIGFGKQVAGLAFAVGPLLDGALTQFVGWRSIFWVNLPIWDRCHGAGSPIRPQVQGGETPGVDPIGQFLAFVGLTTLTYAIMRESWMNVLWDWI
jgi:hypothetical protein